MFTDSWSSIFVRYETFWERTNTDRPILNMSYNKTNVAPYRPANSLEEQWLDAEYKYNAYKGYVAATGFLAEGVPRHFTNYGPGCLAACIGGSFELRPDTIWFDTKQFVTDWENPPEVALDENSEIWQALIREQAYFARDPEAQFSVTDLGGVLDIVASLRGTQNLLYDLYDYPDQVKEFTAKVKAVWNTAFAQQLNTLENAGQIYNTWMNIPSAKPWYPIQCDFCYMLSPQHFSEFVLPDIIDHANLMERSIYHLDGPGELPHLDMLLDIPSLNGIQWTSGASNDPLWSPKWFDLYRKIQDSKKNLVLMGGIDERDLTGAERLIKSIDPAGAYISIACSSQKKAEDLFEKIIKWSE